MKKRNNIGDVSFWQLLAMSALVLGLFALTPAYAHKGAHGVIKHRMDMMKGMKEHLKPVSHMFSGRQAYDEKLLTKALDYIKKHSSEKLTKLFPKGSHHKPSEADPAIWQNWSEFKKLALALNKASDQVRARLPVQSSDDKAMAALKESYVALSKVCKTCHDRFRE